ncbi:MAG: SDR family oxidoreductase [Phycisphaerales bacterium]|nr:SDR family oxidoreductase [Phycisphaerales bacterium]
MFRQKNVLITGASSGIGSALAERFAQAGAQLVLVARRKDRLTALTKELKVHGVAVHNIVADLVEPGACDRIVSEAKRAVGRIDVLVNNAGVGEYGRFHEQDVDVLENMMQLNMSALVRLTHRVLPDMIERRSGHLLNIASTAAFQPTPYMCVYGATKSFVLNFSLSLWEELRRRGIGVTCVCPGPVKTEFFDRGGFETQKSHMTRLAMSADQIAESAYTKLSQGRTAHVPGMLNKLGTILVRFAPLRTVTRISSKLLAPKS